MALIAIRRLRRGRAVAAAFLLLLSSACLMLVAPGAAQAVTCTPQVHQPGITGVDKTAWASFDFASQCSDGNSKIWGTVKDTLCDSRAAELDYTLWDRKPDGTYFQIASKSFATSNGCGTQSTFAWASASPGQIGWRLRIDIHACNGWGCSDGTGDLWYYG